MAQISADYQPSPDALRDRVILVTGAGSGIGRAVAERYAALGATVVLLGRRVPPLEETYDAIMDTGGPEPVILPLDLAAATPENFRELAEKLQDEFGRLDAVVHCAARLDGLVPFPDVSAESWYKALQVNLSAPYFLTQTLLPLLRASDAGRVIFTLDDAGRTARAYWGAYGVSKQALAGLVAILGDEYESTPLRVCGVRPGATRTDLRAKAWAAEDPSELPAPADRAGAFVYLMDPAQDPGAGTIVEA